MANNTIINLILKAKDEASAVLTGAAAKITALISAFAGGAAIHKAVEDLTEMDRVSRRLAMSVEELSAGQYAAFRLSGTSAEDYSDILMEVAVKMEEWSSINAGGATDFFEIMKVDVQEFMKLNPQEQFLKIADTMKDMSASAKRAFTDQIGSDVFRNMLPAIEKGGDEFRKAMEQAQKFNQVVSSIDSKAVSSLNTEIQMLGKIADGTFKKAFAGIAPELQALVQIIQDQMLDMASSANGPIATIGDSFADMVESVIGHVSTLARIKDTFDVLFYTLKSSALLFVGVFLSGMQVVGDGVVKTMNGVEKTLRSAFAGFIALINNQLIKPTAQNLGLLGFDSMVAKLNEASKNLESYRNELNAKPPTIKAPDIRPTINWIKGLKEESDKALGDNLDLVVNGSFDDKKLVKEFKESRDKIRNEQEKAAADDEKYRKDTIAKGGDAKFDVANVTAAANIANSQAKLRADLAKMEIEQTIQTIETKKQLELSGLEEKARIEGLSANKIADMRMEIELDAAKKVNEQRRKQIDEDIKVLETQIAGQRSIMATEVMDAGRGGAAAAIVDLEAEISRKKQEQINLGAELVRQSSVIKAGRAAELGALKSEIAAIKESAEIELKAIRGDSYGSELDKIEKDFADTIKKMEDLGDDSTAIQALIDAKKAQVEMVEIERQYGLLKRKLDENKISPFEYLKEVDKLGNRGSVAADVTQNPEDITRMSDAAQAARAEVFDLGALVDTTRDSLTSGLEGLFADFISGTKSAKEAFADFAQSVLMDIGKMIGKLLVQLAIQSLLSAFSGGSSATAGGAMSSLFKVGMNHTGGKVGKSGMSKYVPWSAFIDPEYHHLGGIAGDGSYMPGLKDNEVPAVLLKGEEVLTQDDPRHADNLGKGGMRQAPQQQKIDIYNMLDNKSIANSVESSEGSQAVMNIIRANSNELRAMLS